MWFSLVTLILPGLAFASQTTLSKVSDTGEFSSQKVSDTGDTGEFFKKKGGGKTFSPKSVTQESFYIEKKGGERHSLRSQ
jgi:hypothetical protein